MVEEGRHRSAQSDGEAEADSIRGGLLTAVSSESGIKRSPINLCWNE